MIGTLFFIAFMVCGCSVETCMDSPQNMAVTVIAALVAILCAWAMGKRN